MSGDSSKLHEMNPRKRRAASHKASRMRCAGTPRTTSPLASPATPKRNAQEWQDSRLMHDSRSPRSEKRPFLARSSRGVFPNGCLQGFSDAWRAYPAKASSFRMHGARILPRTGDFPVQDHFRDAWSAKPATDCRPGTHRGGILPLPVRPRAHQGAIPPPSDAGERISRAFCHRRAPGNAPWHNLAVAGSPKMHRGNTLPRQPPSRMLLDDILPRRPSTARACCEIAVVPRSRKTPPERSVGQLNTTR